MRQYNWYFNPTSSTDEWSVRLTLRRNRTNVIELGAPLLEDAMNKYIVSIWTEACRKSNLAEFPTHDSACLFAKTLHAHLKSLRVVNKDDFAPLYHLKVTDLRTSETVWEFPQWYLERSPSVRGM